MKYLTVCFFCFASCSSPTDSANSQAHNPVYKKAAKGEGEAPDSLKKGDSFVVNMGGKKVTIYSSSTCTRKIDTATETKK